MHAYFNIVELKNGELTPHVKDYTEYQPQLGIRVVVIGFSEKGKSHTISVGEKALISLLPRREGLFGRLSDLVKFFVYTTEYASIYDARVIQLHHWQLAYFIPLIRLMNKKVKVVLKRYGTLAAQNPAGKNLKRILALPEVIAMKTGADLLVMVDDGTQGDKLFRALRIPPIKSRVLTQCYYADILDPSLDSNTEKRRLFGTDNVKLVAYVARVEDWKRQDRFMRVALSILKNHPDRNSLRFMVVGGGPLYNYYRELLAHASHSTDQDVRDLGTHMTMTGHIGRVELARIFAATDIHMALYDYSCVGIATLEGMLRGRCTMVCDSGDTSKLLTGGAIILPCDDAETIAKTAVRLLCDDTERAIWERKAAEHVRRHFISAKEYIFQESSYLNDMMPRSTTSSSNA